MHKFKTIELLTILIATIVPTLIVLGVVRYFAPQLLGLSSDIRLVQTSKKIPPFFDGVFRISDYLSDDYIIPDPYVKRAKPFFPEVGGIGPNDLLGFRNRNIPNVADFIIIGDSQTYGINARIDNNWPNLFINKLNQNEEKFTHYDIAVGGWGSIEYLELFYKSLIFKPKFIIVAFYTGNDPLETFRLSYSNDRWAKFQTNDLIDLDDMPKVEFPPKEEEFWEVKFADNVKYFFTPQLRLYSNQKTEVVKAGYEAMLMVAEEIYKVSKKNNVVPVFTIIPTKELVYKDKIFNEVNDIPDEYKLLVKNEYDYIEWFSSELLNLTGAQYINVVNALQQKALGSTSIYPSDGNGHPNKYGYEVIANQIFKEIELNWYPPHGLVALFSEETKYQLGLVRDGKYWQFLNTEIIEANGWPSNVIPQKIYTRDIANFEWAGIIDSVDKEAFGPR